MEQQVLDGWGWALRLGAFALALGLAGAWEAFAPRRARLIPRTVRWTTNLGLVGLDSLVVRVLFPAAAVGFAALAAEGGWGLLNHWQLPPAVGFVLAVVALDLAIYFQHVMFHAVPGLWRLHRVHHADPEFDVTTGVRFHPVEIVLSMLVKIAAIAVLGAGPLAVLAFELLLNVSSLFTHANASLPRAFDRALRAVLVTPDMHRIHHSRVPAETHSNFGFSLAVWDRLFGTYRAESSVPQERMAIGLDGLSDDDRAVSFTGTLAMPFAPEGRSRWVPR